MARKILFAEGGAVDGLKTLSTSDKEGLGVLYEDEIGRVFRYVKNSSSTALQRGGSCFKKLGQTSVKNVNKYVLAPDAATGPTTCMVNAPAGVPVTGIGASGAGTGDYGWIQVAGPCKVSVAQSATAALQSPGCFALLTGITFSAAHCWDKPVTTVIDSTNGGAVLTNGVRIAEACLTTGVATAASMIVNVFCLN